MKKPTGMKKAIYTVIVWRRCINHQSHTIEIKATSPIDAKTKALRLARDESGDFWFGVDEEPQETGPVHAHVEPLGIIEGEK